MLVIRYLSPEKTDVSLPATINDHPWALPPILLENSFRICRNTARIAIGQARRKTPRRPPSGAGVLSYWRIWCPAGSTAGGVKRETGKRLHIALAKRANHAKHEAAWPVLSPQRSRGERNEACSAQCVQGHCLQPAGGKANAMSRQPGYRPGARGREPDRHSLEPRETDTSAHARRRLKQPSRVTRNIA
ncbi:hypothetical protein SAMN05446935_7225 [Burkholderia sp. YR290]|nr:hypothetical protein SAMN05446934_5886 [Paraburkholderia hospita]SKC91761.1 hypothetical protein SAMN05445504_6336 [Burkholderia sp. CF099]SOE86710.1 hypothetical protein SAMN05446935_7225 [Burkholderia sp. YR290]